MDWILKLFALFKRNSAEEYKAVIEGWKGLSEGYKARADYLESKLKEVVSMESENADDEKTMELLHREKEYLKQLIELTDENRRLEEEIIFLKILYNVNNKK